MLTHSTHPTPTRGFDLKCFEYTTLMRELPGTLHRMLRARPAQYLLKEDVLWDFHRRGVSVTAEMLKFAVLFQSADHPDGKRRVAGVQVKPMVDAIGRWHEVFALEERPAA